MSIENTLKNAAHNKHDVYMKTLSSIFPLENVKALENSLNQETNVTLRMCDGFFSQVIGRIGYWIYPKKSDHEDLLSVFLF